MNPLPPPLQPDEVKHYQREGWVVPRFRLPSDQVDRLRDALDELLRRNPGVRPEKLVSAHIERDGGRGDNGEGVRGVAEFLALGQDRQIVDLVSSVIGDDLVLWGCHVFCKPAREGYETPWHQDGHYWPIRPLATCTAWVALEPSTRANGCLRVIPGSHRDRQLWPHLHEDRSDLTLNQRGTALHALYLTVRPQPAPDALQDRPGGRFRPTPAVAGQGRGPLRGQ